MAPVSVENRSGHPCKLCSVLLVEDNPDDSEVITVGLELRGYGVRVAKSREEGLEYLQRYYYDAIILDYCMAGLGAAQFLMESQRISPRSGWVLISALPTVSEEAQKLGISQWLRKPFLPEDLVRAIQSCSNAQPNAKPKNLN